LKSLIDLGGIAKRKEIKRDIYDNSALITEDYIDFARRSKKQAKNTNHRIINLILR